MLDICSVVMEKYIWIFHSEKRVFDQNCWLSITLGLSCQQTSSSPNPILFSRERPFILPSFLECCSFHSLFHFFSFWGTKNRPYGSSFFLLKFSIVIKIQLLALNMVCVKGCNVLIEQKLEDRYYLHWCWLHPYWKNIFYKHLYVGSSTVEMREKNIN